MSHNGFIDLRIGEGARDIGGDSVWPSFTDIMTVVVMIFLMALIIIMLRYNDINSQLSSSIDMNAAISRANKGLSEEVMTLSKAVALLKRTLLDTEQKKQQLNQDLLSQIATTQLLADTKAALEKNIGELTTLKQRLTAENQSLLADKSSLQRERDTKQQTIIGLGQKQQLLLSQLAAITKQFEQLELKSSREVTALTKTNVDLAQQLIELEQLQSSGQLVLRQYQSASEQIILLAEQIRRKQLENAALQQQAEQQGQSFVSLQERYDSLEAKYRSLVRAARNTAGKQVAQIYFIRADSSYQYRLQAPGQPQPQVVTKAELEQRLSQLKARLGLDLYTQVIIPENSNLSHDEAWRFTQEMLNKYDYYHQ